MSEDIKLGCVYVSALGLGTSVAQYYTLVYRDETKPETCALLIHY